MAHGDVGGTDYDYYGKSIFVYNDSTLENSLKGRKMLARQPHSIHIAAYNSFSNNK
jgi:hypothetical protein